MFILSAISQYLTPGPTIASYPKEASVDVNISPLAQDIGTKAIDQ